MTWVLVFMLLGTTQPSFVSTYPDKDSCEIARSAVKSAKVAFCLPIGK